MLGLRAAVVLILLLVLAPVGARTKEALTPAEILSDIFREARRNVIVPEAQLRGKYMSKSLLALWTNALAKKPPEAESDAFGWGITAGNNAYSLKNFEIRPQSQDATKAVLAVKQIFRESFLHEVAPDDTVIYDIVIYDFVRESGRWRIDNIRNEDSSLRKILEEWLSEPPQ